MLPEEAIQLLDFLKERSVHVVIRTETPETDLEQIKDLGYAAYLCLTTQGNQIVITDKFK